MTATTILFIEEWLSYWSKIWIKIHKKKIPNFSTVRNKHANSDPCVLDSTRQTATHFFFKDLNVINRPSGRLKFNWHLDSNLIVNFFRSEKAEAIFEFDPIWKEKPGNNRLIHKTFNHNIIEITFSDAITDNFPFLHDQMTFNSADGDQFNHLTGIVGLVINSESDISAFRHKLPSVTLIFDEFKTNNIQPWR